MRREQIRAELDRDREAVIDLVVSLVAEVEELNRRLGQDSSQQLAAAVERSAAGAEALWA